MPGSGEENRCTRILDGQALLRASLFLRIVDQRTFRRFSDCLAVFVRLRIGAECSGDWTQNCNSKNVDTTKFVNMMQAVNVGKQIDWICPFCSGTVERLEQKGGKTVIGCTSCDMRIQIEN